MKTIAALASVLFCLNTFAMEVEVISAEYQVVNEREEKTLCLTVARDQQTGELMGIVEDIHDCFYARSARRNPHLPLNVDQRYLEPVSNELLQHLQRLDSQLTFYFSDGE